MGVVAKAYTGRTGPLEYLVIVLLALLWGVVWIAGFVSIAFVMMWIAHLIGG